MREGVDVQMERGFMIKFTNCKGPLQREIKNERYFTVLNIVRQRSRLSWINKARASRAYPSGKGTQGARRGDSLKKRSFDTPGHSSAGKVETWIVDRRQVDRERGKCPR